MKPNLAKTLTAIIALSFVGGFSHAATTPIFETGFDGANGTAPAGFTYLGGVTTSNLFISNSTLRATSTAFAIYSGEHAAGLENYTVSTVFRIGGNPGNGIFAGLVVGYQDASNFYQARMNSTSTTGSDWRIEIYKHEAGNATLLASTQPGNYFTYGNAANWSLSFTINDGLLSAFLYSDTTQSNLVASLSVADSTFTSGSAGIRANPPGGGAVVYDSFAITAIPEPRTTAIGIALATMGIVFFVRRRRVR